MRALSADAFRLYEPERIDFDFGIEYYKTDANFASNGSRDSLASGNYLSVLDFNVLGRYVLNSQIGLMAGMQLSNSESSDLNFIRKNSALSYLNIGGDYLLMKESDYMVFSEVLLSYPFEKVSSDTDSVLNSDGAIELKPQATLVFFKQGYSPYASAGLNYRTEGLATLITYAVGADLEFDRMGIGANFNGYFTFIGDQKTEADRAAVNNRVNGGSSRFYSYNPKLFSIDTYLKFYMSRDLMIKADLGYSLIGYNTSSGMNLGFGVTWGFGGNNHESYSKPAQQEVHESVIKQPVSKPVNKPSYKPLPKAAVETKPEPVPPVVKLPKTPPQSPQPKQKTGDSNYIKQIEGSPKSLEKATEPETSSSLNETKVSEEYAIKLKKIKKPKKAKKKSSSN